MSPLLLFPYLYFVFLTHQERNKKAWTPTWAPPHAKSFASLRLETFAIPK